MRPILFRIPLINLPVPAYGAALMVGFLLATCLARRRAKHLGLAKAEIFDLGFFAILGGVIGARLLFVGLNLSHFFEWPAGIGFFAWLGASLWRVIGTWNGGLAFYGGLAGGIGAIRFFARRRKIPFIDILDFVAAPVAVGLAVTRVGCFLNGCCFGKICALPWAVTFPEGSHVYDHHWATGLVGDGEASLPVHPAQLYETLAALAILAAVWLWYPRRKFAGQIAASFGMLYTIWRFFNEFFRADSGPWMPTVAGRTFDLGPLTVFQYMSVPIFAAFAAALILARRAARPPFSPPPSPRGDKSHQPRNKR